MTISQVCFTSRQEAESLRGDPAIAVISITDPGSPPAQLAPLFLRVLRLSFFDAIPADEYMPALPGLFDRALARQVNGFIEALRDAPEVIRLLVHCEYGVSRSAAVALFAADLAGAPLAAREYAYEANVWVLDRLLELQPGLQVTVLPREAARERRLVPRPN